MCQRKVVFIHKCLLPLLILALTAIDHGIYANCFFTKEGNELKFQTGGLNTKLWGSRAVNWQRSIERSNSTKDIHSTLDKINASLKTIQQKNSRSTKALSDPKIPELRSKYEVDLRNMDQMLVQYRSLKLKALEQKIEDQSKIGQQLRISIVELRDLIQDNEFPTRFSYVSSTGQKVNVTLASVKEARQLQAKLENQQKTQTDLTSDMKHRLQNTQQEAKEFHQTFSAMLKSMHATLKAIIQNMKV